MKTEIINKTLTYEIRKTVLWPHIKNNDYTISVDNDPNTFHLGTFLNNKVISIGTFVKENNSKFTEKHQYRLRAMATHKEYRKRGAGKMLFLKGLDILKSKKITLLWCDARLIAIPFYESVNMKSVKGIYHIKYIAPQKTMYIALNK